MAVSILHATLLHASARRRLKLESQIPSVEWCYDRQQTIFLFILISVSTTMNESLLPESPLAAGVR